MTSHHPIPRETPSEPPCGSCLFSMGALDLLSWPPVPGKTFHFVLSKHVPNNVRCHIWAHCYVNFNTLLGTDPVGEDSYELVKTPTGNLMLAKPKPKVKVDGWASWNKA